MTNEDGSERIREAWQNNLEVHQAMRSKFGRLSVTGVVDPLVEGIEAKLRTDPDPLLYSLPSGYNEAQVAEDSDGSQVELDNVA